MATAIIPSELKKATPQQLKQTPVKGLCIIKHALDRTKGQNEWAFSGMVVDDEGTTMNWNFRGHAATTWDAVIKPGQVYEVQGGITRPANRKWSATNCPRELWVQHGSNVRVKCLAPETEPALYAAKRIPHLWCIKDLERGWMCNLLCGLVTFNNVRIAESSSHHLSFVVADSNGYGITVLVFGEQAIVQKHRLQAALDDMKVAAEPPVLLLTEFVTKDSGEYDAVGRIIELHNNDKSQIFINPSLQLANNFSKKYADLYSAGIQLIHPVAKYEDFPAPHRVSDLMHELFLGKTVDVQCEVTSFKPSQTFARAECREGGYQHRVSAHVQLYSAHVCANVR